MILDKERFMNAAKIEEDDPYVDILLPHVQALCMDVARAQTEEELAGMPEATEHLPFRPGGGDRAPLRGGVPL